jgi:hypothetical protein
MQHRYQACRVERPLADEERLQLRVPVLLDEENLVVIENEVDDFVAEWECAHTHEVQVNALCFQGCGRLVHGRGRRAEIQGAVPGRARGVLPQRFRHEVLGRLELAQQPLHVVHVGGAFLRVAGVAIPGGAAGEESSLGRVRARIGAERDSIAVHIEVAAELTACLQLFGGEHLAAVNLMAVIPLQGFAQPLVHADIEVQQDENRRLEPVGEIERQGSELEALAGILGE